MITTSTSFKNKKSSRQLREQVGYQLGCYYTNQEVPNGYAKLLVNYDYTDDGKILKPRMGITNDAVLKHSQIDSNSIEQITLGDAHLDGLLYFKDLNDKDQLAETILSFGHSYLFGSTTHNIRQGRYFNPSINNTQGDTLIHGDSGWTLLLDKRDTNRYSEKPYYIGRFKKDVLSDKTVGFIRTKSYSNIDVFNTGLNSFQIDRPVTCNYNGNIYTICTSYLEQNGDTITGADPNFKLSRITLKEEVNNNVTEFNAIREPVAVKKPTLTEAASVGFNMLSTDPYDFPNKQGSTSVIGLQAYRPKDDVVDPFGEVLFTANTGETIRFNCVYSFETATNYQVQWEYKGEGDEDWKVLKAWTSVPAVGVDKYIYYDVVPNHNVFSIQVKIRKGTDDATMRLGIFPRFTLNIDELKNLGTETFNLNTATGMFVYNNMLGLYGVEGAETTIFFSDIENPGYFPFPHNIDSYDEYILKVVNYLDSLLVITTTSIYTISGKGLPSAFIKKKLITNLNITELDAELIKVIKDQVFFKADNTFFVLKPNTYTGDATDLRAYEVSKAINTYLQNFKTNTLDLFNKLYPLRLTEPSLSENKNDINLWRYNDLNIKGYNQHVVDGKLQIILRLELICNKTPNLLQQRYYSNIADLTMIYDTLTKQWYLQVFNLLNTSALRHRRIDNQTLLLFDNMVLDGYRYLVIAKNTNDPKDYYKYTLNEHEYDSVPKLPNWQFINTGIIPLNNTLYKRLRELQFTVDNVEQQTIKFSASIYADGENVLDGVKYTITQDTNPNSDDYGHIYINTYDLNNLDITGATALDDWVLDFSKFPDVTLVRSHMLLTGKGRFISGEFINRDEKRYELSNTIWVCRLMNGR